MALAGNERQYDARAHVDGKMVLNGSVDFIDMTPVRMWMESHATKRRAVGWHDARAHVDGKFSASLSGTGNL